MRAVIAALGDSIYYVQYEEMVGYFNFVADLVLICYVFDSRPDTCVFFSRCRRSNLTRVPGRD